MTKTATLRTAAVKPPKRRVTTTYEQGTGYAPELLAAHAAQELRCLLRLPRYDAALPDIIAEVAARAERCWQAQPRWRTRWTRAGQAGNLAPLLVWFRHWTAAAAVRNRIPLPAAVLNRYALGVSTPGESGCVRGPR
ncbi:MAG: hypothetical protein ACRCXD_16920 [Luteolibacter sp.]